MDTRKSYYAIIPASVRYDVELTPNAKLLYGEITALCNEKGYCWASNDYFASLYGVSKVSISTWVNQLVNKGYLESEMIYKEDSREIKNRYLRIGDPIKENFNTPLRKLNDPIKENFNTPIKENFKDNNTLLNNTSNNTLERDIGTTTTLTSKNIDDLVSKWNELNLQQLRGINKNTNRHKMLRARVNEYGLGDVFKAISNIGTSSFLKGQNKKGWTITFDWLVKPNNFIKVLEGNYADKKQGGTNEKKAKRDRGADEGSDIAEQAGILSF